MANTESKELIKAQPKTLSDAEQDLLARLDNRHYFLNRLDSAITCALDKKGNSLLLVVRINNFNQLLERLGKAGTNLVLNEISEFLSSSINHPFTAARLADNEFGLLLFDASETDGHALTEFLYTCLQTNLNRDNHDCIVLKTSIGMTFINSNATNSSECINNAKLNYESYPSATPDGSKLAKEVVEHHLFELHYQALITFLNNPCLHYEVLMRHTPENFDQLLDTATLFRLAGIHNLGCDLDKAVLQSLLTSQSAWPSQNIQLFVHVSGNTLANLAFPTWINSALEQTRASARSLVFQVKAAELEERHETPVTFARKIQALGIGLCITGFGTTTDPVPLLKTYRPSYVKLDTMLVENLLYSNQQQRQVQTLVRAIHGQNCRVIAPCIENLELLPILWEMDVDLVQGNCLQEPSASLAFPFPTEQVIMVPGVPIH